MPDEKQETLDLALTFITLNGLAFNNLPYSPTNIPIIDTIKGFVCLGVK